MRKLFRSWDVSAVKLSVLQSKQYGQYMEGVFPCCVADQLEDQLTEVA